CDCLAKSGEACLPDMGVVGAMDPVAADTASMDLLDQRHGKDVFGEFWPRCNHRTQLEYGQEIALGSMKYELVRS
ncbi:MAG: 4Fe-4S ferredoxin, partial [Phycisphaerae bacterium]